MPPGALQLPIMTSLTQAEADRLALLAEDRNVLEIGSAYGFSTVVMALTGGEVTAVDPHTAMGSASAFHANLSRAKVERNVRPITKFSQEALPILARWELRFDLIFVDGDHTTAGVEHDLKWSLELLKPGGILAVHDVLETCCCPDVGPAVDRMLPPYELVDSMAVVIP